MPLNDFEWDEEAVRHDRLRQAVVWFLCLEVWAVLTLSLKPIKSSRDRLLSVCGLAALLGCSHITDLVNHTRLDIPHLLIRRELSGCGAAGCLDGEDNP